MSSLREFKRSYLQCMLGFDWLIDDVILTRVLELGCDIVMYKSRPREPREIDCGAQALHRTPFLWALVTFHWPLGNPRDAANALHAHTHICVHVCVANALIGPIWHEWGGYLWLWYFWEEQDCLEDFLSSLITLSAVLKPSQLAS